MSSLEFCPVCFLFFYSLIFTLRTPSNVEGSVSSSKIVTIFVYFFLVLLFSWSIFSNFRKYFDSSSKFYAAEPTIKLTGWLWPSAKSQTTNCSITLVGVFIKTNKSFATTRKLLTSAVTKWQRRRQPSSIWLHSPILSSQRQIRPCVSMPGPVNLLTHYHGNHLSWFKIPKNAVSFNICGLPTSEGILRNHTEDVQHVLLTYLLCETAKKESA